MKSNVRKPIVHVLAYTVAAIVAANALLGAAKARQLAPGEKAKIFGVIISRDGELVRVHEKKPDDLIVLRLGGTTKIERKKYSFPFYRHTDMDVTALLPGLTIEAEGIANSNGQLDASKISFTPDEFAVEVAQEQQVQNNKFAVQNAQSSADQAKAGASQAQSSADAAQASADAAGAQAQVAGALAVGGAEASAAVNQRISDLDQYKNEFEVDVFFHEGSVVLDDSAKRDLANLADIAKSLDGYMVEISGYAAHHKFSQQEDQKLSEERATAVARYLVETKNIPLRRMLMPVGYGATRPVASNGNAHGRELNRHVDVKVLVNKALAEGM